MGAVSSAMQKTKQTSMGVQLGRKPICHHPEDDCDCNENQVEKEIQSSRKMVISKYLTGIDKRR